jgi:hypothetical protein
MRILRGTGVIRKSGYPVFLKRIARREQGSGGLAFQTKDILLSTSVIQRRMAFGAIAHERVSGA